MPGPGEYRPDPTEGITRIEDLPKPKVSIQSRNYRRRPCPRCGHSAYRDRHGPPHPPRPGQPPHRAAPRHRRALLPALLHPLPQVLQRRHDRPGRPRQPLHPPRRRHRRPPGRRGRLALSRRRAGPSGATTACSSPTPRSRTGSRPGGKRRRDGSTTEHLDWALSDFSGYIAADELYDGPFCILSIVDNRTFKRLAYQVLDHDPTHKDIEAFFRRFQRGPGGARADPPGDHDRRLGAVSRADRRGLRRRAPSSLHLPRPPRGDQGGPLGRGPGAQAAGGQRPQAAAGPSRLRRRRGGPPGARSGSSGRSASCSSTATCSCGGSSAPAERATLRRITRGLPQLRTLRGLMEEVYRLFDRRCRTATALAKLADLRARLRRFGRLRTVLKKLLSPGLEKALVFLDERLLGATSNAVERGNRRYRKMQKTVYRVRTQTGDRGSAGAGPACGSVKPEAGPRRPKTLHKARAA